MSFGTWFLIVWVAGFVVAVSSLAVRRRRESPTRELIHGEPVIFATRPAVLVFGSAGRMSDMGATRRKFTLEFKTEAAHRVIDTGRTVAEVAAELSVATACWPDGCATSVVGSTRWSVRPMNR